MRELGGAESTPPGELAVELGALVGDSGVDVAAPVGVGVASLGLTFGGAEVVVDGCPAPAGPGVEDTVDVGEVSEPAAAGGSGMSADSEDAESGGAAEDVDVGASSETLGSGGDELSAGACEGSLGTATDDVVVGGGELSDGPAAEEGSSSVLFAGGRLGSADGSDGAVLDGVDSRGREVDVGGLPLAEPAPLGAAGPENSAGVGPAATVESPSGDNTIGPRTSVPILMVMLRASAAVLTETSGVFVPGSAGVDFKLAMAPGEVGSCREGGDTTRLGEGCFGVDGSS